MSKKPTQAWGSSTMGVYYIILILIHMCNYVPAQVSAFSQCMNTGLLQLKVNYKNDAGLWKYYSMIISIICQPDRNVSILIYVLFTCLHVNYFPLDVERSYDKPWLSSSKKVKPKSEDFSISKQGKNFQTILINLYGILALRIILTLNFIDIEFYSD